MIDAKVEYRLEESGKTQVTHTITLENVFSNLYATSYALVLDNIKPINPVAYQDNIPISLTSKVEGDRTTLAVTFPNPVVGKGGRRTFNISFEEASLATRTGEVWEISIPRLSSSEAFRTYSVSIVIPNSFGKEAYISPKPLNVETKDGLSIYTFDKDLIAKTGITAGFGQFQVFSFTLNYHLENPLNKSALTEIALPPDTAFQKVSYQVLNPLPENVSVDEDGNWLASFRLSPRERIDVKGSGYVQIFASHRPFLKPTQEALNSELKESAYWQTNDPEIKSLARRLQTPKAIYDFVSTNLTYDYQRVKPNVERTGAKKALANPKSAICMEYTDLFIALARAAGIPAREVNGYAYTENPTIQPLSLVADVLHSWPEYWDSERQAWIPVDPTWASTTGGIDYFSKLDLRHFTFVNHGRDPQKPYPPGSYKLGTNPQKDVFVSFGQLPAPKETSVKIEARPPSALPFVGSSIDILITNPGPGALYNLAPTISFDGKVVSKGSIDVLPPFAKREVSVSIPFSFLAQKYPSTVSILVAGQNLTLPTYKNQVIIYDLILIFLIFAIIVGFVFVRAKKISLKAIILKLRKNEPTNNSEKTS